VNAPVNSFPGKQGFQRTGVTVENRASAPPPPDGETERPCTKCETMTKRTSGLCKRCDPKSKRNRSDDTPSRPESAAMLEQAVASLVEGDDWKRWLDVQRGFHQYSWRNTVLIAWQRPDATRVGGKARWAELGRQINPGARPITILAPVTKKYADVDADGEEVERKRVFFRDVHVYDLADTDGEPLPEITQHVAGDAPAGMLDALHAHANTAGVPVRFVQPGEDPALRGGANGYAYRDPFTGEVGIVVRGDMSTAQQAKTFAHELGHVVLGHLNDHETTVGHKTRGDQEVEAESFAYMVSSSWGVDTGDYSFGYVAAWSGGDPKKVGAVAKRISDSVKPYLNTGSTQ